MRASQRSEGTWSFSSNNEEHLDKRFVQVNREIDESKSKIEDFLATVNSKISQAISTKINKVFNMHQNIVESKDKELELQKEIYEKYKETQLYQKFQKMKKQMEQYEENMKRLANILDIYKKQAEKYKIELDIKEKQLQSCRQREKKLIKKSWILQQNIKDIYSYQTVHATEPPIINSKIQKKEKVKNHHRNRTTESSLLMSNQTTSKTIQAHQISKNSHTQMRIKIEERPSTSRQNIYDVTKLNQHLNRASSTRYHAQKSQESSSEFRQAFDKGSISNKNKKVSIYEDVRQSIRKVSSLENEQQAYLNKEQRQIGTQQFRLIMVHLPKILKQIERIKVTNTSFLKEIDAQSITQLQHLFSNLNSVKILEIILFNYSIQALRQIKSKKQTLKTQITYAQPVIDEIHEEKPSARLPKYQKHRVDLAIHKNFKSNFPNKKQYHASLKNLQAE